MATQPRAGEMLVGAYLKLIEECEVVAYGQHSPLEGEQMEVDVIGIQPSGGREVITCEVATHLRGLGYGTAAENGDRVAKKFTRAERYVDRVFDAADTHRFQFWSPNVPRRPRRRSGRSRASSEHGAAPSSSWSSTASTRAGSRSYGRRRPRRTPNGTNSRSGSSRSWSTSETDRSGGRDRPVFHAVPTPIGR
ncbi:hypothetical protein ACFQFH_11265 [Halobaculum halobium]|uniref:hypothetical protein n=1 Tax=Halobaculum halobium TaxID=3032281 RepID=UPI003615E7AF